MYKAKLDEASNAITAALILLNNARMDTVAARLQLLTTGLQESKLTDRYQIIDLRDRNRKGPARGLWQFERMGGTAGVMQHRASSPYAFGLITARGTLPQARIDAARRNGWTAEDIRTVWEQLEYDDVLAAGFARLLYWTDARAIPQPGNPTAAWKLYIDVWRPGKPVPDSWQGYYTEAERYVTN